MGFRKIWDRYYSGIYTYILTSFRFPREEIEDLMQDIMMRAYARNNSYDSAYSYSTWLYTIARNSCIDFMRRRKEPAGSGPPPDTLCDTRSHSPEEILMQREDLRTMERFIGSLQETQREIVFLKLHEGLTYREISKVTGVPAGTLKYRFHQIRENLKKYIREEKNGPL